MVTAGKKKLVELLNQDISAELTAAMQYFFYGSTITGLEYAAVKKDFIGHAGEEMGHAVQLAHYVTYLDGVPTTEIGELKRATDGREMLRDVLDMEQRAVERYTKRVDQARAAKEYALEERLETILAEEQDHVMELKDLLG
ncbi:MAG: ferritin-like domain-containing protein [Deltaproteobacteria bacterium]|nr:ferritin-like domain-containing protein [Deltaproteobacteria bacterium]